MFKVQIIDNKDEKIWDYQKIDNGFSIYTNPIYTSDGTMELIKEVLEEGLIWVNNQLLANNNS